MSRKSPKKQPEKATFTPPSGEGDQPSKISEADVPPESAGIRPQDVGEEVGQLRQRLQRLGADFQNYQKRTQKQISDTGYQIPIGIESVKTHSQSDIHYLKTDF